MRNLIKLFSLLTIAGFMLASCEGPMGMSGLDGQDGKDGVDGLDGKDGKDVKELCLVCHSTAKQDAIYAQYQLSEKAGRRARSDQYCAACHSTEGFQEIVEMEAYSPTNEMLNGTKIGCAACHKHSTFEFSGDTVSQVLRTIAPVYTNWDNFDDVDYERTNASDYGSMNNLCANCHQYRGSRYPVYSDATVPVTGEEYNAVAYWPIVNTNSNESDSLIKFRAGTNFDLHEGANQADYLIGRNGYEYTGATYTRTWQHSDNTCTDCHFNEYNATSKTGGHTMKVNLTDPNCVACHNITTRRTATLAAINAKLVELGELLAARKVFTSDFDPQPSHDFYGTLLPTTSTTDEYALDMARAYYVNPSNGKMVYNTDVEWDTDADFADRIGREWKYGELGAAWNYTYVSSNRDEDNIAVHNPTYAMQLLQSSIDWLTANP